MNPSEDESIIGDSRGRHFESEFAMHCSSSGTSENARKTFSVLATIYTIITKHRNMYYLCYIRVGFHLSHHAFGLLLSSLIAKILVRIF